MREPDASPERAALSGPRREDEATERPAGAWLLLPLVAIALLVVLVLLAVAASTAA